MASVSQAPREHDATWQTHTVFNQPPALENLDVYSSNLPLVEAVEREGAAWVHERAAELGRFVGGAPQQSWGRLANENRPVLRTQAAPVRVTRVVPVPSGRWPDRENMERAQSSINGRPRASASSRTASIGWGKPQ